jgi:hypothetical protein
MLFSTFLKGGAKKITTFRKHYLHLGRIIYYYDYNIWLHLLVTQVASLKCGNLKVENIIFGSTFFKGGKIKSINMIYG